MPFPFSIRYNRQLRTVITDLELEPALDYIKDILIEKRADNVVVSQNEVDYKGSTSNSKGSLFGGLNGTFKLANKEGSKSCLVYEFRMHHLFIVTGIMSVAMGLFAYIGAHVWWVGFAAFAWLCGMNWIINVLRHGSLATDIAYGIDQRFGNYPEKEDKVQGKDAEKLKSWM